MMLHLGDEYLIPIKRQYTIYIKKTFYFLAYKQKHMYYNGQSFSLMTMSFMSITLNWHTKCLFQYSLKSDSVTAYSLFSSPTPVTISMSHLTFSHDLNKFETFYAGLWSFSHLGGKNLFFPKQYLPEFYRGTYRPVENLPTLKPK